MGKSYVVVGGWSSMKQALKKNRFCKDSYYEMDDHTLRYHVLTGSSVPENKVDGVISNLMGV